MYIREQSEPYGFRTEERICRSDLEKGVVNMVIFDFHREKLRFSWSFAFAKEELNILDL